MRIESNSNDCVDHEKRGERTCFECYYAQVDESNRWTGDERCWNAQCLVAREEKQ